MMESKRNILWGIISFFVLAIIIGFLLIAGFSLINADIYALPNANAEMPFEIDQILLKVVLRESDFISREIRIMNIGTQSTDIDISIKGGKIKDLLTVSEDKISLVPAQKQGITLNFSTRKDGKIEFLPGIYIGQLIVNSSGYSRILPVVVELESKDVLFDLSISPTTRDNRIEQNSKTDVEIKLFNLRGRAPADIGIDYFIKDLDDNTIVAESEKVTVKTTREFFTSFFKAVYIPKNLSVGEYVFVAISKYGDSVGTASYLFEVVEKKQQDIYSLIGLCKDNPLCILFLLFIILVFFAIIFYGYLFYSYLVTISKVRKKHVKYHYIVWIILAIISTIVLVANIGYVISWYFLVKSWYFLVKRYTTIYGVIILSLVILALLAVFSRFAYTKYSKWKEDVRIAKDKRRMAREKHAIEEKQLAEELVQRKAKRTDLRKKRLFDFLHALHIVKTPQEKKEIRKRQELLELKKRAKEEAKKRKYAIKSKERKRRGKLFYKNIKKRSFDFLHGIGLVRTDEEKDEIRRRKEEERQRILSEKEELKRKKAEEKQRKADELQRKSEQEKKAKHLKEQERIAEEPKKHEELLRKQAERKQAEERKRRRILYRRIKKLPFDLLHSIGVIKTKEEKERIRRKKERERLRLQREKEELKIEREQEKLKREREERERKREKERERRAELKQKAKEKEKLEQEAKKRKYAIKSRRRRKEEERQRILSEKEELKRKKAEEKQRKADEFLRKKAEDKEKIAKLKEAKEKISKEKLEKVFDKLSKQTVANKLRKFQKIISKAREMLNKKNINRAKILYSKARDIYLKLSEDEKVSVYDGLQQLYDELTSK